MAIAYGDHSLSKIGMQMPILNWVLMLNLDPLLLPPLLAWPLVISAPQKQVTLISLLRVHLEMFGILKQSKQGEATAMIKRTRRMEKVTEHLRKLKNCERKK